MQTAAGGIATTIAIAADTPSPFGPFSKLRTSGPTSQFSAPRFSMVPTGVEHADNYPRRNLYFSTLSPA